MIKNTVILLEKNFYENGKLEKLLSYELRPNIKEFRAYDEVRKNFVKDFSEKLNNIGSLKLSSNYKKILNIEKAKEIVGIINLNIDGLLKLNGAQKLIELEGNISWFYCSECGLDKDVDLIINDQSQFLCNSCNKNILKPSIPFVGQEFSQWDLKDSWMMLNSCDNFIIFADNFLSPVTISFIDVVEKRSKNIFIICSESLNSDSYDFSSTCIKFVYESNEVYLDSLIEKFGDSLV